MPKGVRALLVTLAFALAAGCTASPPPDLVESAAPPVDLAAATETYLTSGSAGLDSVRAVLVSVDGQPRLTSYRHDWTASSTTHVWSVTKSVVGLLVAMAVDDGVITSYDATLEELLPEHRGAMTSAQRALTLRQLMSMAAGMDDGRTDYASLGEVFRARADLADQMLRDNKAGEPGEWLYSNTSAHLVAVALDAALGRNDDDLWSFARERLFDPLGIDMTRAWRGALSDTAAPAFLAAGRGWGRDPQGIPTGPFGLRLTAPDLLKLGQLALDRGRWEGRQLVSESSLAAQWGPSATYEAYGMLWWRNSFRGHEVIVAAGSEGQLIVVSPEQRAVIAVTSKNAEQWSVADGELDPLIDDVIMPALDR